MLASEAPPPHQFSKFKNFLLVCWFLCKNLSNFVSIPWKLYNPYCPIENPDYPNERKKRSDTLRPESFYPTFVTLNLNVYLSPSWKVSCLIMYCSKGFIFYGVTFYLCRFCTFLNSAQLAGWAKFKNLQNLHKSNVTP